MGYADYLLDSLLSCRGHNEGEHLLLDGFALPGDKPHYPRDRVVDMKHVRLDIKLDLEAKRISGSVAHTFAPLNDGLTSLDLDSVELSIGGVRLGDGPFLPYSVSDGRLHIELNGPRNAGEEATVVVDFSGSPRRGLYFIGPDG